MTPDDIVALWREHKEVHAFARAVEAIARAHEREACAKACEKFGYDNHHGVITDQIATAIRAGGQDQMPLFDDWPGGWKK